MTVLLPATTTTTSNKPSPVRRIAMLSVHTCPLAVLGGKKTGGMNVYVRELAREFGRRGIYVDIFTRSHEHSDGTGVTGVGHVTTSLGRFVRVIHIAAGPAEALDPDQVFQYLPEFAAGVVNFSRRCAVSYDLIYSHYWLSGWVAHALRAEWNVPVAQMFHTLGLMKDRIANKPAMQPADQRSFAEADIMTWADRLIAATPAEREQMLWLYRAPRRKIEIVSPGVDLQRFSPQPQNVAKQALGLPTTAKMLLFVGRIEPLKGIDTIFEALAVIKSSGSASLENLQLCVIGGDPASGDAEMARLQRRCTELGLSDVVLFLGAKDQYLLSNYYAAAEALIMPSDYESFGMVALEAMASGTPVIASEVGGLAFLVQDDLNGYHVPVREPAALAEKIAVILNDPAKRTQLAAGALATAKDYSWAKIADRLLAVFERMAPPQAVAVR